MEYPNLDVIVKALLAQGHKVEAVKQVRQTTGWGLKASKDYVDVLSFGADVPTETVDADIAVVDYAAFSGAELLAAVEYAGAAPHLDLIRACLAHQEALTPGLLALLEAGTDLEWLDSDPRWYAEVHAGLLLCAFREPAALPVFACRLREEDSDELVEWFEYALPYYYGPLAIPMLVDLLEVQDDYVYPSGVACQMLLYIALHHPATQAQIIDALRQHLPQVDADGKPLLTEQQRDDPPILWTWIVSAFMDLRYDGDDARVKALFDADVLDTMIFGDWEAYRAAFAPDASPPWDADHAYDIEEDYEQRYEEAQVLVRRGLTAPLPLPPIFPPASDVVTFVHTAPKVGRNDPCPCGSGKKYKQCCGKKV